MSHILTKADASFLKKSAGNGTGDSLTVLLKIWSADKIVTNPSKSPLCLMYIDREDIMDFIAVQGVKRRE